MVDVQHKSAPSSSSAGQRCWRLLPHLGNLSGLPAAVRPHIQQEPAHPHRHQGRGSASHADTRCSCCRCWLLCNSRSSPLTSLLCSVEAQSSRLFRSFPKDLLQSLAEENITSNFHKWSLSTQVRSKTSVLVHGGRIKAAAEALLLQYKAFLTVC